jgi:hypothetical protein
MRYVVVLLVGAMACGGSGTASPEETLAGTWATTLNTGGSFDGCTYGVTLDDADRYQVTLLCQLQRGGWGAQTEIGAYAVDGKRIEFSPEQASCPASTMATVATYAVDGNVLTLTDPTGAFVLRRVQNDPKVKEQLASSGTQIGFGCWTEDATFKAGAIERL